MVYMYYGFFLFLLYMTAPLWLFLLVAAGSWWAMRSSVTLQKTMRNPLSKFGIRGEHAAELERRLKKGAFKPGRDRRRFKRVVQSLNVSYQVLGEEWKKEALHHYSFDTSIVYPSSDLSSNVHHALTWDVSEGGLSITTEYSFKTGEQLKISLRLPQQQFPTTLLAEVRRSKASFRLGKTRYHTGLKILALDQQDLAQLTDYLFDGRPYPQGKRLQATA